MIVGSMEPGREAIVGLRVRGPLGTLAIQAVVDTDFTDWLTVPTDLVEELGFPPREETEFTWADGSVAAVRLFLAEVKWMGRWRRLLAAGMDGGPLLGMRMMEGCSLRMAVRTGGRVEIRSLDG
jgi:clan AA aspartic protease